MRKLVFTIITIALVSFYSCNDGDIITVELDFEDTFESCGVTNLVLFKTKEDPSESLSLFLNGVTLEDILTVDEDGLFEKTYTINATNPFNYRTYSNTDLPSDLFCSDIPNSEVIITQDIESTSGSADLKTVLTEDDNDGIPAILEDRNNNGNLEDDDTDNDGIPDYIDADDDGDNILTKDEDPDPNGDGDLSDALDSDGDSIPDYLDTDDDGDGVKTRDEENDSQDNNPANDTTNFEVGPDYLNPQVATTVPATGYRTHTIVQTYKVTLIIRDIDIQIISADFYDFGELENSALSQTRVGDPIFN
ncbi:hypothetical protein [Algibacter mikhailovii]|uniref:hypothetical protein n=1 Tax=Algibacter mikhailovii TaxID=425498 RepID=UPI0024954D78|nr:hypothetical protein [Algibacter mikhailovii]